MKRFLKNISLFCAVSLSLFLIELLVLNYANTKQLTKFKVSPTIESLTVGDSHAELAINDELLVNNMNLSQRGDPFKYSLLKIKMALERNPSIKKLYLGVSYHNLSSYYDGYISGTLAPGIDARYIFILPVREKLAVIKENISDLIILLRLTFINGFSNLQSDQRTFSFLGKYNNPYKYCKATKQIMDRRLSDHFYENGKIKDFSSANNQCLEDIIQLCKHRRIELIILNTPLHPYYRSKIPKKFAEKYNSIIAQHKLKSINFSDLVMQDSCFTPDGDHVSEKGALLTTSRLLIDNSFTNNKLVRR